MAANFIPSQSQRDVLCRFLASYSLEITPRQVDKIDVLTRHMPAGTKVYVALIEAGDISAQLAAAVALKEAGLKPVAHVPARFVTDRDDLARRLGALVADAGIDEALVLGGGASEPIGDYDAAIQLLETGLFEANGITTVGFAGHPEGNPDIIKARGEPALMEALQLKQAYAREHGLSAYIATQFLFEAGPVAVWAQDLRDHGIDLPVHVGVPGPATIKTLVKYAAVCGVGASARFIRKQALNVTRLLSVSAPDHFITQLAELAEHHPDLGIKQAHFYPFGGFARLFDWLEETCG